MVHASNSDRLLQLFFIIHYSFPGKLVATLSIADSLKPESKLAINSLHKMGMKVILLTGDNERTANAIGNQVIKIFPFCSLWILDFSMF